MRGALANNWGTNKRNTKRRRATMDNVRRRMVVERDSHREMEMWDNDDYDYDPLEFVE